MVALISLALLTVLWAGEAVATNRYADNTLVANCTSLNYSISARDCTGTDGDAYNTFSAVMSPTVAGDTIYIRAGTWTQAINVGTKTGTASAWITIAGYPGERPIIQYTEPNVNGSGGVKARGTPAYMIFENFVVDGVNMAQGAGWQIRDGNHHFILRNIEIKNQQYMGIYVDANDVTIEDSYFHDAQTDCVAGRRYLGFYLHDGNNLVYRRNRVDNMPGGGGQVYPGPWTNVSITENKINNNGWCTTTDVGGIVIASDSTGGAQSGVTVANNEIAGNGPGGTGGNGGGIRVYGRTGGYTITGTKIYNNTIYNNQANSGTAYGVRIENAFVIDTEVINNIILANETGQITDSGTNTTLTTNITTGAITDYTVSTSDLRLKQGTNTARDTGTSVSTRPAPVELTDIGAYEQGILSGALVNDGIDLTMSVMTPGILPTTGITIPTVTCVGCTGTPVATSATVQAAASNVVHLTISGISSPGTCRVSIGTTNMTDSLLIGGPQGTAQGVNSASNFDVTGACSNTGGLPTPAGATAYYKLDDGSGTTANDSTANNNDGTVSSGISWETVYSGTGLRIPNDTTYRHLEAPFGASTNMATAAGGTCALVKADPTLDQKVLFSNGGNGASQRLYDGWDTIGGQAQWGIGIQGSGFATGSEFPVTTALTSVCLQWGSGTATLWVNGVKGAQSGKSVKTYTSYTTIASNFRYGNDGTITIDNGGYDIDEVVFWTSAVSDATIQAYHTDRFPTAAADTCYDQANHQVQYTHLVGGNPVNYKSVGAQTVDIIDGGAAMVVVQFDCTGSDGTAISVVPYYSTSVGGTFDLPVPSMLGVDGIAVYGASTDSLLNSGTVSGNLSGALGNVAGSTVLTFGASPTITLSQDESQVMRWGFRFATGLTGQYRCIKFRQDNGEELAGGYTPADGICFHFTNVQAGIQ